MRTCSRFRKTRQYSLRRGTTAVVIATTAVVVARAVVVPWAVVVPRAVVVARAVIVRAAVRVARVVRARLVWPVLVAATSVATAATTTTWAVKLGAVVTARGGRAGTGTLRVGDSHHAALDVGAREGRDGVLSLLVGLEHDKAKAARLLWKLAQHPRVLTRVGVSHDLGLGDLAALGENVLEGAVVDALGETRDVQVVAWVALSAAITAATTCQRTLGFNLPAAVGGIAVVAAVTGVAVAGSRRARAVTAGSGGALVRLALLCTRGRRLTLLTGLGLVAVSTRGRVLPYCESLGCCQGWVERAGRNGRRRSETKLRPEDTASTDATWRGESWDRRKREEAERSEVRVGDVPTEEVAYGGAAAASGAWAARRGAGGEDRAGAGDIPSEGSDMVVDGDVDVLSECRGGRGGVGESRKTGVAWSG